MRSAPSQPNQGKWHVDLPNVPQYVEFAGLEDEEQEDALSENGGALGLQLPNPNAEKANAQRGNSLEVLLATKNKRILEELTKFRVGAVASSVIGLPY